MLGRIVAWPWVPCDVSWARKAGASHDPATQGHKVPWDDYLDMLAVVPHGGAVADAQASGSRPGQTSASAGQTNMIPMILLCCGAAVSVLLLPWQALQSAWCLFCFRPAGPPGRAGLRSLAARVCTAPEPRPRRN